MQQGKTEQDLILALDEWQKTFDAIPDLIAVIDTNHRIVRANKAMALKLACPSEEADGCYCFTTIHGLKSVPDFCPNIRTLLNNTEEHCDLVEHRLGGIFEVSTTPIFDDSGKLTGSVHVARDITMRKQKEQMMLENLALGEFALHHSMNELVTLTIDKAELLAASKIGFFHFLDDDETTISLQSWSTNTVKDSCNAEGNALHYPIDQAGVWVDCVRERCPVIHNDYASLPHLKGMPEGHATVKRELTVPIVRGDKVVAILGVGNKPTDYDERDIELVSQLANFAWEFIVRKRYEEALHQSELHARALLDAIPDLMFRMTREGVYLDYQAVNEDLYAQSIPIIGRNNRDLTPPDFADLIESNIRLTLDQMNMVLFEYQLPIPGKGLRDFEARMVPSGPDEVTAISRDITDRKKSEKALKKKIEELEWFNHMMIDRELKMIELKKEINALLSSMGKEEKYVIHKT
jgi:two-component system, sensor histidine kinase and response regulator